MVFNVSLIWAVLKGLQDRHGNSPASLCNPLERMTTNGNEHGCNIFNRLL